MSKYSDDETASLELESRPPKLGLGAKDLRVHQLRPSNDPLERKIQDKVKDAERKAANVEDSTLPANNSHANDENDDSESRTNTFTKKRPMPVAFKARMMSSTTMFPCLNSTSCGDKKRSVEGSSSTKLKFREQHCAYIMPSLPGVKVSSALMLFTPSSEVPQSELESCEVASGISILTSANGFVSSKFVVSMSSAAFGIPAAV
ncbi:hypothetical protein RJ641_016798 [Dillenia turbinata]|uniref:Uncharacterized protein n=1 Tax=Dillenia turbinata TaxID=194707 RepID=A0AAN8YZ07_9MAGN